jgi:hypothetical protein
MDDTAGGIATAALTLQSVLLHSLVYKGLLTPSEALEVVDKSLDAIREGPDAPPLHALIQIAHDCLQDVRDGVADLVN